jgi:AcrR family transcriptional regulator
VRRPEITAAVMDAVLKELSEVGFGRLTVEGVARRAGVAKTAVYRRWASKLDMVIELMSGLVTKWIAVPDTGSLQHDLEMAVLLLTKVLQHPLASKLVPELLAEAARNPHIEATLRTTILIYQHETAALLVGRAVARGELPADTDPQLIVDFLVGPLYWRVAVVHAPISTEQAADFAASVGRAIGARSGVHQSRPAGV